MSKQPPTPSSGASSHLIANPVANLAEALPQGSYIITGGMYGSAQERIIVHTGGLPSAPAPPPSTQPQLSPVFFMPPPASQPETSQRLLNMTHPTTKAAKASRAPSEADEEQNKTTSLSLPSFGGSFDQLSHHNGNGGSGGGMRSPLLGGEEGPKITRTPLPVIGGKL